MRRVRRSFLHEHSVRAIHTARTYMRHGRELINSNQNANDSQVPEESVTNPLNVAPSTAGTETTSYECPLIENMVINAAPVAHTQTDSVSNIQHPEIEVTTALDRLDRWTTNTPDDNTKYGRILRSIREVISCCACFSSDSLMKECTNGHLICQNCFLTLRQDERPQCPTCRASLYSDSRKALIAQKVLSELPDFCTDCGSTMLHKSLASHRLNTCTKRRVACGLSALGCEWVGTADQYDEHYNECSLKKQLAERPLTENLDMLLTRFKKREHSMRETYHCFSNMLRHLESHELQTATVTLASITTTDNNIQYRSDHFHVNQSRWTAEIIVNFPPDPESFPNVEADPNATEESDQLNTSGIPECPITGSTEINRTSGEYISSDSVPQPQAVRRRRWFHGANVRHHPYGSPYYLPHILTGSSIVNVDSSPNEVEHHDPGTTEQTLSSRATDIRRLGDIHYRMLKENSPSIGRRAYAFALLQIKVPETGIQIYARPQLQPYRFSNRGDHTTTFSVYPIRWRYIRTLRELLNYRLIQAEFVVARRIVEEHVET
ncbi:Cysteine and histidine rich protein 1 [Fasciolopsis buskii]|uniref:Cysteine and histidine rich protein 1 n=1 Tax=Fasciolopsis buskii TaxID=27845 RepID=A0A8E0RN24_9TREM|nr:Cysteine and histidine rich protein 1 [Fasciolopsis buski]